MLFVLRKALREPSISPFLSLVISISQDMALAMSNPQSIFTSFNSRISVQTFSRETISIRFSFRSVLFLILLSNLLYYSDTATFIFPKNQIKKNCIWLLSNYGGAHTCLMNITTSSMTETVVKWLLSQEKSLARQNLAADALLFIMSEMMPQLFYHSGCPISQKLCVISWMNRFSFVVSSQCNLALSSLFYVEIVGRRCFLTKDLFYLAYFLAIISLQNFYSFYEEMMESSLVNLFASKSRKCSKLTVINSINESLRMRCIRRLSFFILCSANSSCGTLVIEESV